MSTTLAKTAPTPTPVGRGRTTFVNVLRSEWTKFWSVRSTFWTILAAIVVTIGFSVLIAWGTVANWNDLDAQDKAMFDPTSNSMNGLFFGQLAVAVLGVLVISAEYSTGGVRTTFVAVPKRLSVILAKAVIIGVSSFVIGLVFCFISFELCNLFYATKDVDASLGDPGVARGLLGGGLYVAGTAMFGFSLGTLLRHSAGSIVAAVALLLVVPPLTNLIPGSIGDTITRYFTSNAGSQITSVIHASGTLQPWAGYAVFTIEWLIILAIGAVLLQRRDA